MPSPPNGVHLVCFDLGGVILRICRSWREGCAAAGIEVRGDVEDALGNTTDLTDLLDAHQTGRIDLDAYARGISAALDGLYRPGEIKQVHAAWMYGEYDGIGAVVDRIHDAGIETAVLSNTDAAHWAEIIRYPTPARLRNKLASHEIAIRKPDPRAYEAVQEHTGIAGAEVLFFDDLPENVEAARGLGWRAEQVDPAAETTAVQIERVLVEHGVLTPHHA